ncbi:MAG: agmatine deiminase family protein, partial [bacterium]|nr:agmatine deiminase family protein [bacterium]
MAGETPDSLGFLMPAEWAPHAATWIAWPHNGGDWPGKMIPVYWVYGEIVRKLVESEQVHILVNSKAHEDRARRILVRTGVDLTRVGFFRMRTNRGWTRDFGPIFVRKEGTRSEVAVVDFQFNAWAKYPDWKLDDGVARAVAKKMGLRVFPAAVDGRRFVLEGGAVDGNGRGALLTTEECLLDPEVQVRNPGMSRVEVEAALRDFLGTKQVIWLGKGIVGDDTHGHVDDLCRFVNETTVVLCRETDSSDANYRLLEENRERLEGVQLINGSGL